MWQQDERRENSARITGNLRRGKTHPNRPTSRSRGAAPGRPRPQGSSAARTSRPRGRYGGHPDQEPARQLSPHRRDKTMMGHDRPRTCRATGNDRLPSRLPTVRTGGSARRGQAVAFGNRHGGCCWAGPAVGGGRSWPGRPVRMARTPTRTTPKDLVRVAGGRTRLLPADGPLGVISAPRNSHDLPESRSRESRPTTRRPLNLTAATAGGATHRPAVRRPDPSVLLAGTPTRISRSNRVGPSGRSGI
jgi:hypothetical protein